MGIGMKELLIILLVVLLVFGAKKLQTIGSDLGSAVRGFKKSMSEGERREHASRSGPMRRTPNSPRSAKTAEKKDRAGLTARHRCRASMFEVGFAEILVIAVLALIVLGPEKLPRVAAQVGRWMGRARAMARQFREQLEEEVNVADHEEVAAAPQLHLLRPRRCRHRTGRCGGACRAAHVTQRPRRHGRRPEVPPRSRRAERRMRALPPRPRPSRSRLLIEPPAYSSRATGKQPTNRRVTAAERTAVPRCRVAPLPTTSHRSPGRFDHHDA